MVKTHDNIYGVNENLKDFNISDYFFNLHKQHKERNDEVRLVDLYRNFVNYLEGKVDLLNGNRIDEVTSWKFEECVNEFVKNLGNLKQLQGLFEAFKVNELIAPKETAWVSLSTSENTVT